MNIKKTKIAVVLRCACKNAAKDLPLFGYTALERMKKSIESAGFYFAGYKMDGCVQDFDIIIEIDDLYPLLSRNDLTEILDYFIFCRENIIKFFGGFIMKTANFIKRDYHYTLEKYFSMENAVALTTENFDKIIKALQSKILNAHIINDVLFMSTENVHIDEDVKIGTGTVIYSDCYIRGKSVIGNNCVICQGSCIDNCKIFDNVKIVSSSIAESEIGSGVSIGPYANIRPKSVIGENCKIGNFVEIKKSKVASNTKISHLAYVGDADIGKNCNIGCGVIFCNFDGKSKHNTIVGDNVFVGSNCNLIAPVKIENNAFIAAGTTVTDNVLENAFCIGRSRQLNKFKKIKN